MANYRITFLILCLGFFFNSNVHACKCKEISRDSLVQVGLRQADIVFLGELNLSDSSEMYSFKILELFKGN